jgi:hypothetical protein
MYRRVSSGIVRINVTACDGGAIGPGFLIGPDLVATVAHVVDGAASIDLKVGPGGSGGVTSGVGVGTDAQRDLALVRTSQPTTGHIFSMADHSPSVGREVAAIGFWWAIQ